MKDVCWIKTNIDIVLKLLLNTLPVSFTVRYIFKWDLTS